MLTFNSSGTVSEHLVLHPQLDANNFIVKTIWMPGSQTELALVTADFVKIYDLSRDVLSPQYYFLVPSGKVRDCTLAFMEDGARYLLIMSSAGHIYYQVNKYYFRPCCQSKTGVLFKGPIIFLGSMLGRKISEIQRYAPIHSQGFKDEDLGSSPGWWAASVGTYCPSRPSQLTKKNITIHGD